MVASILAIVIGVILAGIWIYQFTFMMALDDATFPGRSDKALWCAAFLVAPILAPFAFRMCGGPRPPSPGNAVGPLNRPQIA